MSCQINSGIQNAYRIDAKLIGFNFTAKRVSEKAVVFWISGKDRIESILRVNNPHDPRFECNLHFKFEE